MLKVMDTCPTCGGPRVRQAKQEKALIVFSDIGPSLILEYTKEGALEKKVQEMDGWADQVLDLESLEEDHGKFMIWEGAAVERDDDVELHGKFRELTFEEHKRLSEGTVLSNG